MRLRSDARHLCLVRAMVRSFSALAGFDEARAAAIVLAVDEGCANAIRHSYGGRSDGEIEVTCRLAEGDGGCPRRLLVSLRDFGRPADPERVGRALPLDLESPGGLGLHLIRGVMDSVDFRCPADGGNLLELAVACPGSEGDARSA